LKALRAIMDIRRSELPFAALMSAQFFLIIAGFWMLKPLKKGLFIEQYDAGGFDLLGWQLRASQAELLAKVLNVAVAFAAMALFSWLSRRLRRQDLTLALLVIVEAGFVAFAFWLRAPSGAAAWSFYAFGDLFNMLLVGAFFAFLNDSVSRDQARRTYGLVVLGGVLGGAFGSLFVRAAIDALPPHVWMWVGFGSGLLIGAAAIAAGRMADRGPAGLCAWGGRGEPEDAGWGRAPAALEGISMVARSRYLLAIAGMVALYEVVSTLVDFQFTEIVARSLDGPGIREHFSTVYLVTNAVAVAVQLFGTGLVMSRLGVAKALLVLPAAILLGSAGFVAVPALLAGSFLSVADNGLNYSVNQSAREALYVPCRTGEKYRAKAFIDMFVQRFAKAGGVLAALLLSAAVADLSDLRMLSVAVAALALIWIAAARYAGKRYEPPVREEPGPGVGDAEGA